MPQVIVRCPLDELELRDELGPGPTLLPTPRRRKRQLSTLEGVRGEMSPIYRDVESGKRDSQEGARLVYMLTQIGDASG